MDVEGVDPAIIIHCNDGEFQGTFLTNSISSLVPEIPMKNVFCKCFNGQARWMGAFPEAMTCMNISWFTASGLHMIL